MGFFPSPDLELTAKKDNFARSGSSGLPRHPHAARTACGGRGREKKWKELITVFHQTTQEGTQKMGNTNNPGPRAGLRARDPRALAAAKAVEMDDCIRDGRGGCYSRDGRRLLAFDDGSATAYEVRPGVEELCASAFAGCRALRRVALPPGLRLIGSSAFEGCAALEGVAIPDSVAGIGASAFSSCTSLSSCTLPTGLRRLGAAAFAACPSLGQLVLPRALESIGGNPLPATPIAHLVSLSPHFTAIGPWLLSADGLRLIAYTGAESEVETPRGLRAIGDSALACSTASEVSVAPTVEAIGPNAFGGCSRLERVDLPQSLESIPDLAFAHCTSLRHISLPKRLRSLGAHAFEGCSQLEELAIPDSVEAVGDLALGFCPRLQAVSFGRGVATVCAHPLLGSSPGRMESRGEALACQGHALLSEGGRRLVGLCADDGLYRIPEGVATVGCLALAHRPRLERLEMGRSVVELEAAAVACSTGLTEVAASPGLEVIGRKAFFNCRSLKRVTLNAIPARVAQDAFAMSLLPMDEDEATPLPLLTFVVPKGCKARLARLLPDYKGRIETPKPRP